MHLFIFVPPIAVVLTFLLIKFTISKVIEYLELKELIKSGKDHATITEKGVAF